MAGTFDGSLGIWLRVIARTGPSVLITAIGLQGALWNRSEALPHPLPASCRAGDRDAIDSRFSGPPITMRFQSFTDERLIGM